MKRLAIFLCVAFLFCGCQRFNIGPKGEGENVIGSATIPYVENDKTLKKRGVKLAELNALDRAVRVFLSSSSKVEFPDSVKKEILGKPDDYIKRSYINTAYRKGSEYFVEVRALVLVSNLAAKVKALEENNYVKKTNIYVASRDITDGQISLKQYCRQGIYQTLKNYPYTMIDGGNLSENNLVNINPIIDKAKKEGARFVIFADSSAAPLEAAAQLTSSFKPIRAKASLKVVAVNNYQTIAEVSGSATGLDPVADIAYQKALTAACDQAAAQIVEPVNSAVNSAKTFRFIFKDVKTIERLERLQNILQSLAEVEDFTLKRYNNSDATFEVQANVSNIEELAAKIIRKHYSNFSVLSTRPDEIEIMFM